MKTILTFVVKVDVEHSTPQRLRDAICDVRENLGMQSSSHGGGFYILKTRSARLRKGRG